VEGLLMSEEEKIKFVIEFSNFINSHISLFEGMYKLFKNGESELDLEDCKIDLKATNFDNIKKPDDVFFTTMLLMYLSMKQLENNIDYIQINEDEMLEVGEFIEYARNLPYFKDFIKENS
jgi:hypothetical protein